MLMRTLNRGIEVGRLGERRRDETKEGVAGFGRPLIEHGRSSRHAAHAAVG